MQAAVDFPPERIEAVAYKIATKAFPVPRGSKKKSDNLGLTKTTMSLHSKATKKAVEHGRTYNAAHETEHFAVSMAATGLRGNGFSCSVEYY